DLLGPCWINAVAAPSGEAQRFCSDRPEKTALAPEFGHLNLPQPSCLLLFYFFSGACLVRGLRNNVAR
ncbi:MAG TPA: hypothetical protein VFK94_03705, partial [Patescibacteria group bacterium]|nr:hypothetical protein [Patescibacteria group bacterium]